MMKGGKGKDMEMKGKGTLGISPAGSEGGTLVVGKLSTLPETNISPKYGWLEYYFPIGEAYFQGLR